MRLRSNRISNFQIITLISLLVLTTLADCLGQKDINQPKSTNYTEQYFYLKKDEYGCKNARGNVLLHLPEGDSIYVNPEEVVRLSLYIDWAKKEFPHEVYNFPNLKYLWIGMRSFEALPPEITQLSELEHLDLQHSGVKKLPDNFGELKKLERLTLLFSNIETLPTSICELTNLKSLHLGGTKIKKLPPCLHKLKKLEEFILFYADESTFSQELQIELKQLQNKLTGCYFFLD